MQQNDINSLWDISDWEEYGDSTWKGWKQLEIPPHLNLDLDAHYGLLHVKGPISISSRDIHGWGKVNGTYTISDGYRIQKSYSKCSAKPSHMESHMGPQNPSKGITYLFVWMFAHGSNFSLEKTGIKEELWGISGVCFVSQMRSL